MKMFRYTKVNQPMKQTIMPQVIFTIGSGVLVATIVVLATTLTAHSNPNTNPNTNSTNQTNSTLTPDIITKPAPNSPSPTSTLATNITTIPPSNSLTPGSTLATDITTIPTSNSLTPRSTLSSDIITILTSNSAITNSAPTSTISTLTNTKPREPMSSIHPGTDTTLILMTTLGFTLSGETHHSTRTPIIRTKSGKRCKNK